MFEELRLLRFRVAKRARPRRRSARGGLLGRDRPQEWVALSSRRQGLDQTPLQPVHHHEHPVATLLVGVLEEGPECAASRLREFATHPIRQLLCAEDARGEKAIVAADRLVDELDERGCGRLET